MSRSPIRHVVHVRAVGDPAHSVGLRDRVEVLEEFTFAVVTATPVVAPVGGVFDFTRFYNPEVPAPLSGETLCRIEFGCGVGLAPSDHYQGPISEDVVGGGGE